MTFNAFANNSSKSMNLLKSISSKIDINNPLIANLRKKQQQIIPANNIFIDKQDYKGQPSENFQLQSKNTREKVLGMYPNSSVKKKVTPKVMETKREQINPPIIQKQTAFQTSKEIVQNLNLIVNSLNSVYQIIRSSSLQLLRKIKDLNSSAKHNHNYTLRKDQINRLEHGLSFYKKSQRQQLKILQIALNQHPFAPLISKFCQHFQLDPLKAFYLIKEIHKKNKIIQQSQSFFINIKQENLIPQAKALKQCEAFLLQDKNNIINCYMQILQYQNPSKRKVLHREQEYNILYRNMSNIQLEDTSIHHTFITFFESFWHNSPESQRHLNSELNTIRKKLISLDLKTSLKMKLRGLNIDELLESNELSADVLEGSYKFLYYVMIDNKEEFISEALECSYINKLSIKWGLYIDNYLKKVQFKGDKESNMKKAIYICNILKSYYDNKGVIAMQSLQRFVEQILNNSILLSILILNSFQIENKYLYFLTNIFDKYNEQSLSQMIKKEQHLLSYYYGCKEKKMDVTLFGAIELQIIKKIMKRFVRMDDIEGLERELMTYGVESLLNFQFSARRFNFMRYYSRLIHLMPSQHVQINRDALQLLTDLKKKGQDIELSLSDFINILTNYTNNATLIEQNILDLPTLSSSQYFISSRINKWLIKLRNNHLVKDICNADKIINVICERLVESEHGEYVDLLNDAVEVFEGKILSLFSEGEGLMKVCELYVGLRRVQQWSQQKEIQVLGNEYLMRKVRTFLSKQSMLKQVIQSNEINTILKIYILISFHEPQQLNDIKQRINTLISNINLQVLYLHLLIDLLSALLHHPTFFASTAKITIIPFHHILKSKPSPSLSSLQKLIKIGIELGKMTFDLNDSLSKEQVLNCTRIIQLINYSSTLRLKQKQISPNIYSQMLNFLSTCKFVLQFKYHMHWLKMGLDKSLLPSLKIHDEVLFISYVHYVINMTICLKMNKVINLKGEYDVQFCLRLFQLMGRMVLDMDWSQIDEFETFQMLEKTIKLLIRFNLKCLRVKSMKKQVIFYLNNLYEQIKMVIQEYSCTKLVLINLVDLLQKEVPIDENDTYKIESHVCKSGQQLQEKVNKCLWQLVGAEGQFEGYKKVHENIKKLVNKNRQYQIGKFSITESIFSYKSPFKENDQRYVEYFLANLQLANSLIKAKYQNFTYFDCQKPFAFIFDNVVHLAKKIKCTSFQTILAITSLLNTYNFILRSNMTSALHFSRKHKMVQNIQEIAKEMMELLLRWQIMPKDLLSQDRKLFFIDFRWKFMNQDQIFTLWNLVQYNQKLVMIRQLLILLKLLNGCLTLQNQHLKARIIQFLRLYCIKSELKGQLSVTLRRRCMDWCQDIAELSKQSLQQWGSEIVFHLSGALGQLQIDQLRTIQYLQRQMYICR